MLTIWYRDLIRNIISNTIPPHGEFTILISEELNMFTPYISEDEVIAYCITSGIGFVANYGNKPQRPINQGQPKSVIGN